MEFIEKALNDSELEFINQDNFTILDDKILTYSQWNWNYEEALKFQKFALRFIKEHRDFILYITCNHPHCYTVGRGLQKGKDAQFAQLIDFSPEMESRLSYPVHYIKRGGGLTFHFPGQWIIYPIVNLNGAKFTLKTLTYFLLEKVKDVLEKHFGVSQLDYQREFLGLWREQSKVASVGIGVERFVTYHGLALNMCRDNAIFQELLKINPCGLDANIYKCVDEIAENKYINQDMIKRFNKLFFEEIQR